MSVCSKHGVHSEMEWHQKYRCELCAKELVDDRDSWKARAEKAEADVAAMIEKAAAKSLDGYRELGARAAKAEAERDQARAEAAQLRAILESIWMDDQNPDAATWHKLSSVNALQTKSALSTSSGKEALELMQAARAVADFWIADEGDGNVEDIDLASRLVRARRGELGEK